MPWETKFDIDIAIDRATDVFWAKGYKATSLSDLLEAMEINKGSFYNTFGSKKSLFSKALEKYDIDHRRQTLSNLRSINDPVAAIPQLFDLIIEQTTTDQDKKGCFIVNTALDLPNHDDETNEMVTIGLKEVEAFFKEQVELGINKGSMPQSLSPEGTAKTLLTLAVGCRVLARGVFKPSDMDIIRKQVVALIS